MYFQINACVRLISIYELACNLSFEILKGSHKTNAVTALELSSK